MTAMSISATRPRPAAIAALVIAIGGIAAILGVYFFQYVLGLVPCPLCLDQRKVYYVAIPLALVVALAAWRQAPRPLVVGGLALLVIAMLIGAAIAVYHSGVEWKFWEGPRDCSGPISDFGKAGGLLEQMQATSVVRCDQATRFLGVSLANVNVIVSLVLAAVALMGIRAEFSKR
jgi:disulfide bond formation protein DsbB